MMVLLSITLENSNVDFLQFLGVRVLFLHFSGRSVSSLPRWEYRTTVIDCWFQGPPQKPKSMDAQVPHIKWCGVCMKPTHILSYPDIIPK